MEFLTEVKNIVFVGTLERFYEFKKNQSAPIFNKILRHADPREHHQMEGWLGAVILLDESAYYRINYNMFDKIERLKTTNIIINL